MSLRRHALLLAATVPVLGASACSGPPPAAEGNRRGSATDVAANQMQPAAVPAEHATAVQGAKQAADYLGKWIGPEGLVLEVKPRADGGLRIVNQWTLDDQGVFEGSVTVEGLSFVRDGEAVTAKPSDGNATGMKWLAGKKDCLTVKPGEGYCRG